MTVRGAAGGAGRADIVVGALGSRPPMVTAEAMTAGASRRAGSRPMLLIDAAMPGDIEPAVDRLDGVFRYNLDDLERVAMRGRRRARAAADAARLELDRRGRSRGFRPARAERAAVPAHGRAAQRISRRARRGAGGAPGGDAATATRLLINRLLHDPTAVLREIAGRAAPTPS